MLAELCESPTSAQIPLDLMVSCPKLAGRHMEMQAWRDSSNAMPDCASRMAIAADTA